MPYRTASLHGHNVRTRIYSYIPVYATRLGHDFHVLHRMVYHLEPNRVLSRLLRDENAFSTAAGSLRRPRSPAGALSAQRVSRRNVSRVSRRCRQNGQRALPENLHSTYSVVGLDYRALMPTGINGK